MCRMPNRRSPSLLGKLTGIVRAFISWALALRRRPELLTDALAVLNPRGENRGVHRRKIERDLPGQRPVDASPLAQGRHRTQIEQYLQHEDGEIERGIE